jgi:hypothetical protein
MGEHMGFSEVYALRTAIQKAARNIPFAEMMIRAADEASRLAGLYPGGGMTEIEILAALVAAVRERREGDATPKETATAARPTASETGEPSPS